MKKIVIPKLLILLIVGGYFTVFGQEQKSEANTTSVPAYQNNDIVSSAHPEAQTQPGRVTVNTQALAFLEDISFEQINILTPTGELEPTDKGYVIIPYTPGTGDSYFNITFYNYHTGTYHWGVQNLWLPGQSYTMYPQQIGVWFPLDMLGYSVGQSIESIDYILGVSSSPMMSMPTGDMLWKYVTQTELYHFGRISDVLPDDSPLRWFPDSWLEYILSDVVYISCNADDPTSMPNIDLDKSTRDGEVNGCGPAAATNSLQWLKKMHPEIDFPANVREGFNQLSSLMNRKANGTVSDRAFIKAKVDFVEMYNLPIKVKYQDNSIDGAIKSSTGRTEAECKDANAAAFPTKDFLISEAKDGEDVEVGVTFTGGGHWVALSGTYSINNDSYINYKHDRKQKVEGGTVVDHSRIVVEGGKMKMPGLNNGVIDILVSESFDPNHTPPSSSASYDKYCQWTKRLVPPGYKIEVTYPDDVDRCYNSTVYILDKSVDPPKNKKVKTWNMNKGKTRKYVNNTTLPVLVSIHNDDKYSAGGEALYKGTETYMAYTIDIPPAEPAAVGEETDADNQNEYAGFSLGSDDDSSDEFGDLADAAINFTAELEASLGDLPQSITPNGTTSLTITFDVTELNAFWDDLEFNLGIISVDAPGTLTLDFSNMQVPQTVDLTDGMDLVTLDIGGVTVTGNFEFTISTTGTNTAFTIDNIGIASKVPMSATGIEDETGSVPTEFQLMQNYPNPFNPSTTIRYGIPSAQHVTLRIYNTLGQEVAALVNEFQNAGYHNVEWNIDELGSGVYFYKLTAGSFVETKKCIIMK